MKTLLPHIIETQVAEYFSKKYGKPVFLPIGYHPFHDGTIFNNYPDVCFEVKLDTAAMKTGNIALEVSCRGSASGISRTKASSWLQCIPSTRSRIQVYEFDVPELRDAIKGIPTVWGGDDKQSELVLFPLAKAETLAIDKFTIEIPWRELVPYWAN